MNQQNNDLIDFTKQCVANKEWDLAIPAYIIALESDYSAALDFLPDSDRFQYILAKEMEQRFPELDINLKYLCIKLYLCSGDSSKHIFNLICSFEKECNPLILYELYAHAYMNAGFYQTALKIIKIIERESGSLLERLNNDDESALYMALNKANCYLELGYDYHFLKLINQINSLMPSEQGFNTLAFHMRNIKRYDEALKAAKMAYYYNPNSISALFEQCFVYKYTNNPLHYEYLLELIDMEKTMDCQYYTPFAFIYLNDYEKALKIVHDNLEFDPNSSQYNYTAAEIYSLSGMVDTSCIYLQKAICIGTANVCFLRRDPALENLRNNDMGYKLIEEYISDIQIADKNTAQKYFN